jgi:predicted RND superfamily exporter protein
MHFSSSATRLVVPILALAAFTLPLVGIGARQAVKSNANDVRDWLPAHYPETQQFRWFSLHFGSEDFVLVSWPGCTLDDERLDQYARWVADRAQRRETAGEPRHIARVTTGRELVTQLTGEPIALSRKEAIGRLTGVVIGPDGQQTCAVVTLDDVPHRDLHGTLAELRIVARGIGLNEADVHLGGPPVVNAAIDKSSSQSLIRLAGVAGLVGLAVAWMCFRTIRLTVIVFVVAMYSAVLSLAIVPLAGVPMNAILVTMVPLVYVAAMSGAIHLSNYYLDVLKAGRPNPIARALSHAALPLGLATGTTAVGLLSLLYSDLAPIRLFGIFSAIGVGVALFVQFTLLPALLTFWPDSKRKQPVSEEDKLSQALHDHVHGPDDQDEAAVALSPRWKKFADEVIRRNGWVTAACLLLLLFGGIGLSKVETSIQIMRLFSPDTPIIASYSWLEDKLGGALVPMEIVLRFDAQDTSSMAQRLALVKRVQGRLAELPDVRGSLSAATFSPVLPKATTRSLRSFMVNRRLKEASDQFENSGFLAKGKINGKDSGEELWRISLRVNAVRDIDYGVFQKDLAAAIDPILEESAAANANGDNAGGNSAGSLHVKAVYTGAVPIIYQARRSLLYGLALGFGTDVALIVVAVTIALRHWSNGLLMLLASVFPMTLVFGLMGWTGTLVDIGSVMTPCVALGVTVDDIFHFVLWFRRGIQRGDSAPQAVRLAYQGCGRAMVQSWGVIGLGLAAFALSTFVPTFRFGALMIGLLSVGLVGNLLFLPALLAGPLGSLIAARIKRRTLPPEDDSAQPDEPPAEEVSIPQRPGTRRRVTAEPLARV